MRQQGQTLAELVVVMAVVAVLAAAVVPTLFSLGDWRDNQRATEIVALLARARAAAGAAGSPVAVSMDLTSSVACWGACPGNPVLTPSSVALTAQGADSTASVTFNADGSASTALSVLVGGSSVTVDKDGGIATRGGT
jgi:prepilin-type N-terminal cleavage/methylation domain-containing protein